MKIYCKNDKCRYNKKLDKPINFQFRKHHFDAFDNLCEGECSKDEMLIIATDYQNREVQMDCAICFWKDDDEQIIF